MSRPDKLHGTEADYPDEAIRQQPRVFVAARRICGKSLTNRVRRRVGETLPPLGTSSHQLQL